MIGSQSNLNDIHQLNSVLTSVSSEVETIKKQLVNTTTEAGDATYETGSFAANIFVDNVLFTPDSAMQKYKTKFSRIGNVVHYYIDLRFGAVTAEQETILTGDIQITLPFVGTEAYCCPTFRHCTMIKVDEGNVISASPIEHTNRLRFQNTRLDSEIVGNASLKYATGERLNVSGYFFI